MEWIATSSSSPGNPIAIVGAAGEWPLRSLLDPPLPV